MRPLPVAGSLTSLTENELSVLRPLHSTYVNTFLPIVRQASWRDWTAGILVATILLCCTTYCITWVQSSRALRSTKMGKSPPILPYWIPYLGHSLSFLISGPKLVDSLIRKYNYGVPAGLRLGPSTLYIISDPNQATYFTKPNAEVDSTIFLSLFMKALATPAHVHSIYANDDSGPLRKPLEDSNVLPEHRIRYFHSRAAHQFLSGASGARMGQRYAAILNRRLSTDYPIHSTWTSSPDLYIFIRDLAFPAAVESILGTRILEIIPTLNEDYWTLEYYIPTLVKRVPRWLAPKAYQARKKILVELAKWLSSSEAHSDYNKVGISDPEWDPHWGTKYVKERQRFLNEIPGVNDAARASEALGLLFGMNTNSIPATYWVIFEVFTRPKLLERVRQIVESNYDSEKGVFDMVNLGKNSLLLSICHEVTRMRVVGIIARGVISEDLNLGQWRIQKGSLIGYPSRTAGMNEKIWNTGTSKAPHPLDQFWEDRFLIYPYKGSETMPLDERPKPEKEEIRGHADGRGVSEDPIFSMKGLKGSFVPFNDGAATCPGKQFSISEMIATLATLALFFDVDCQTGPGWSPRMSSRHFPFGTLRPGEKVPFKIRRRQ